VEWEINALPMLAEYEDAENHQQKEVLVEVVLMEVLYIQGVMEVVFVDAIILFLFIKE
jgi:hypothetical protein